MKKTDLYIVEHCQNQVCTYIFLGCRRCPSHLISLYSVLKDELKHREKALTVDEIKWVFFQLKSVWAILISSYFNAEKKSKTKEKEKVKKRERKKKNQRDSSPWTRHTYPR